MLSYRIKDGRKEKNGNVKDKLHRERKLCFGEKQHLEVKFY